MADTARNTRHQSLPAAGSGGGGSPPDPPSPNLTGEYPKIDPLRCWIVRSSPRGRRLFGDITNLEAKLRKLKTQLRAAAQSQPDPIWLETAERLIDDAKRGLLAGAIDEGWKSLHAAERECFFGMSPAELQAAATALRKEASDPSKFPETSWRRKAIVETIDKIDDEMEVEDRAHVLGYAAKLRDERSEKVYYRYALARRQLLPLSGVLLVLLATLLYIATTHDEEIRTLWETIAKSGLPVLFTSWLAPVGIAITGAIGATVSAIMSFANASSGAKIPERQANALITVSRPGVGAASALIVVYAFQSQLLPTPELSWPPAIWVIAFAAGFSERLVMRAVEATNGAKA